MERADGHVMRLVLLLEHGCMGRLLARHTDYDFMASMSLLHTLLSSAVSMTIYSHVS